MPLFANPFGVWVGVSYVIVILVRILILILPSSLIQVGSGSSNLFLTLGFFLALISPFDFPHPPIHFFLISSHLQTPLFLSSFYLFSLLLSGEVSMGSLFIYVLILDLSLNFVAFDRLAKGRGGQALSA